MSVSYDVFTGAFLSKITEYEFAKMTDFERSSTVDGYMKRAISSFKKNCKYDLTSTADDTVREFDVDIAQEDLDEIVDIISEGMVAQWLKPYAYQQENLENTLSTKDFSTYSPAELLLRISNAYAAAKKDFVSMVREYSYNHGDLTDLHL
jgi:hypothetical protein